MVMAVVMRLILAILCLYPIQSLVHSLVLVGSSGRFDARKEEESLPLQLKRGMVTGSPRTRRTSMTCLHAYPTCASHMQSYSFTTSQMVGSMMNQETLPNILGVNPVEGAIIFGVLYYIYGPTTLYEYAREAVR